MGKLNKADRGAVLAALEATYGGEGTALDFRNPFELLIAVMLSAQSTDVMVNRVTPGLFAAYPDAAALAQAEVPAVLALIAKIGLAPTKAKNAVAAAQLLVARHGGAVPAEREALEALPGVGRKTANVVLSNAFGVPAMPVDTHVHRVANRLGLAQSEKVEQTEDQLCRAIPKAKWAEAHHWLIWHGRRICLARGPKCGLCPVATWCRHRKAEAR